MTEKEKVEYTIVNVNESLLKFARRIAKKKQENSTDKISYRERYEQPIDESP